MSNPNGSGFSATPAPTAISSRELPTTVPTQVLSGKGQGWKEKGRPAVSLQQKQAVSLPTFLPPILGEECFKPGNTINFISEWENITSDQEILQFISGIKEDFITWPPIQDKLPPIYRFNDDHKEAIDGEVDKLLKREIVSKISHGWKFVSNVFIRPKPNNKWRLIIDLSPLNVHIRKEHFKMDNLNVALDMLFPGAFMASIDLRDAYYTLPIAKSLQPYVYFQWNNEVFMFHAMPFGLTSAPRIFTKVMKAPMAILRQKGIRVFNYIDDLFIMADTMEDCEYSVKVTCEL